MTIKVIFVVHNGQRILAECMHQVVTVGSCIIKKRLEDEMTEQTFSLTAALSGRVARIQQKGCRVGVTHDFQSVAMSLRAVNKPYLTPTLSHDDNDFTKEDSFWMTLSLKGEVLGAVGAKVERLGFEPVSQYWKRIHQRQYGEAGSTAIDSVSPLVDGRISGEIVYFGDLFIDPEMRKMNVIEDFGHAALFHAAITWRARYYYAFLKDRDLKRGFGYQLGLMSCIRRAQVWSEPSPTGRGSAEACCYSSMEDVLSLSNLETVTAYSPTAGLP